MDISDNIRRLRIELGISQEKLAELVGVSRQAVAKWETGVSKPNSENLYRIAEALRTDIYVLSAKTEGSFDSTDNFGNNTNMKKSELKRRLLALLIVIGVFIALNLIMRITGCIAAAEEMSIAGILFGDSVRQFSYLFGWLISTKLYYASLLICVLPVLFGKYRLSASAAVGFALGLASGELFGRFPAGEYFGHGDLGWLIWAGIFLFSVPMGVFAERIEFKIKNRSFLLWLFAYIIGILLITLLVKLTYPVPNLL